MRGSSKKLRPSKYSTWIFFLVCKIFVNSATGILLFLHSFRGVVQLFNAVQQQQTEIDKKLRAAGPLERKREKVMKNIDKRAFLDVLMGGTKTIAVEEITSEKKEEDKSEEKVSCVIACKS